MSTYYVSANGCDTNSGLTQDTPLKTIKKLNSLIKCGDTVMFRRGDTFYGQILPPREASATTTYTYYGEGPKPIISQYKTALPNVWENCGNDVWRIDLSNENNFTGNVSELDTNVGFLKVDGRIKPRKCFSVDDLEDQWDFYNDKQYAYIKSFAPPSSLSSNLKLACNIICMRFSDNLIVDGLVFMGSGAHGISGTVNNAIVRNCEFHELGGSELLTYFQPCVRYGNGLECWTDSSDVLVENCRFSRIYDVAITMQGDQVTRGWVNMTFRGNVIWNCQQSFEIWSSGDKASTGFKNCIFENNVCIDSGYCWGYDVRPNKSVSCHLLMYSLECPLCDVVVRNNTFYGARVTPIFKSGGPDKIPADYQITQNTFFIDPDQDVIFRQGCFEESYQHFFKYLCENNQIIESEF